MYRVYDKTLQSSTPRYCEKCRSVLENKRLQDGYNAFTGEEVITNFLVCPNARLDYSQHDGWRVIQNDIKLPEPDLALLGRNI